MANITTELDMDWLNNQRAYELGLGTYKPENYYRILGGGNVNSPQIYQDVLESGQIRGTPQMGMSSYFSKGLYQPHYASQFEGNTNYLIEATPEFNPNKNPVYKPASAVKYRALPSIAGIPAPEGLAFPVNNTGSKWITQVNGSPAPAGTYSSANPIDNPTFKQRIDPRNQYGLKMSSATLSGQNVKFPIIPNKQGNFESIAFFDDGVPKWETLFDYTKDFKNTSIPTHGKNVVHIGKTVLAQPETKAVLAAAGDVGVKAGGVASLLIDAPEFYYDASKKRDADARTAAKANWWDEGDAVLSYVNKPKSLAEKLILAAESSLKSAANAITFGAAYGGTGKNRPKRGLGEMERSTDDMYRILKERGDKIVKQKAAE